MYSYIMSWLFTPPEVKTDPKPEADKEMVEIQSKPEKELKVSEIVSHLEQVLVLRHVDEPLIVSSVKQDPIANQIVQDRKVETRLVPISIEQLKSVKLKPTTTIRKVKNSLDILGGLRLEDLKKVTLKHIASFPRQESFLPPVNTVFRDILNSSYESKKAEMRERRLLRLKREQKLQTIPECHPITRILNMTQEDSI